MSLLTSDRRPLIRIRGLNAARKAGRAETVAVTLDFWPGAKRPALPAIPFPADADPAEFDWTPLAGVDVMLIVLRGADRTRVARAVAEIQAVVPRRLIVTTQDGRYRFARSVERGVEWEGRA